MIDVDVEKYKLLRENRNLKFRVDDLERTNEKLLKKINRLRAATALEEELESTKIHLHLSMKDEDVAKKAMKDIYSVVSNYCKQFKSPLDIF
jgi:predicted RNase H-like nuclease (RuvC/YqgF family)